MAFSGHASYLSRNRIRTNVQERKKGGTPETPGEEETIDLSWTEVTERILSQPVKAREKRRKKPRRQGATLVVLLGAIGIGGIAAIIGLRYIAERFGVNWIGD